MNLSANIITILSLLFGFISILFALSREFNLSASAIIFSVCLDGFDGYVARSRGVATEFGRELDSLVDAVSFGLAPVLLCYAYINNGIYSLSTIAFFIYLVCAVIRLTKYNIAPRGTQDIYFLGLPTTVSGALLASFVLIYNKEKIYAGNISILFVFLVLFLALLMVSSIRYLNLKGLEYSCGKMLKPVLVSLAIIILLALRIDKVGITLFSLILIYLIFSPFVVKRINKV